jgi:hypothetical protein
MVIVMIIGLAEPGQGEKLRRNNKKKAAGEREREREREREEREKQRHQKLIKRQLVVV